tara:strand:- start:2358 stop:2597 length:240 start_codon:yes stop_codon:yes gene_type:complete
VKNGHFINVLVLLQSFFEVLKKVSFILNITTLIWQSKQGLSQHFIEVLSKEIESSLLLHKFSCMVTPVTIKVKNKANVI